jgi:hypothetical protein
LGNETPEPFNSGAGHAGAIPRGDADAPLEGVEAATTVRVRGGDTQLSEGPALESQEILGGYYPVDVPDRDAAVALAAKMPNIEHGSVEVRPVVVFPGSG